MKHLLSIEAMDAASIGTILENATVIKAQRGDSQHQPLAGQTWAMIFTKSSTRTRVSFETGIRELGGGVMFLNANDLQLGRGEPIQDTARVLGRMVHGAVIRTFAQSDVEDFAQHSGIPTINALTDAEHPCQILTDIFTYQEARGPIAGKVVTFIGDGACNVPISWIWAAGKLGFELRIAAPKAHQPCPDLVAKAGGNITVTEDCNTAAEGADLLYTDVWVSMGMESETAQREQDFAGYQINEALVARANEGALVMHCLPAYRGKEIDEPTLEAHAETIFTQAENRLHVQKAILNWLVK
ncbi:MAG: ornithine carbamoyltransferase [Verrucomicrobiales bacterium]|nr:ornithine carbamoyltransferase [Verrucomicrobiales bacterium]|tara:strand:+ start:6168 stop:7064 length:897 start_codon:yes stop_codon:yes gene_type:complete